MVSRPMVVRSAFWPLRICSALRLLCLCAVASSLDACIKSNYSWKTHWVLFAALVRGVHTCCFVTHAPICHASRWKVIGAIMAAIFRCIMDCNNFYRHMFFMRDHPDNHRMPPSQQQATPTQTQTHTLHTHTHTHCAHQVETCIRDLVHCAACGSHMLSHVMFKSASSLTKTFSCVVVILHIALATIHALPIHDRQSMGAATLQMFPQIHKALTRVIMGISTMSSNKVERIRCVVLQI